MSLTLREIVAEKMFEFSGFIDDLRLRVEAEQEVYMQMLHQSPLPLPETLSELDLPCRKRERKQFAKEKLLEREYNIHQLAFFDTCITLELDDLLECAFTDEDYCLAQELCSESMHDYGVITGRFVIEKQRFDARLRKEMMGCQLLEEEVPGFAEYYQLCRQQRKEALQGLPRKKSMRNPGVLIIPNHDESLYERLILYHEATVILTLLEDFYREIKSQYPSVSHFSKVRPYDLDADN